MSSEHLIWTKTDTLILRWVQIVFNMLFLWRHCCQSGNTNVIRTKHLSQVRTCKKEYIKSRLSYFQRMWTDVWKWSLKKKLWIERIFWFIFNWRRMKQVWKKKFPWFQWINQNFHRKDASINEISGRFTILLRSGLLIIKSITRTMNVLRFKAIISLMLR